MCVSASDADFTDTIVYTGLRHDPDFGRIAVFGYQNTAENRSTGPNAMLLHLPTELITPEQFIPVHNSRNILADMANAVGMLPHDGIAWMGHEPAAASAVTVFDHDIYTVLIAEDATAIPNALSRVNPRRRPVVSPELCEFYADVFPGHTIVLCCFNNAEKTTSDPLLLWYWPTEPDLVTAPLVDEHTGQVPILGEPVERDQVVVWSTDEADDDWGISVGYRGRRRHTLQRFLPDRVTGIALQHKQPGDPLLRNGDVSIAYDDLIAHRLDRAMVTFGPQRVAPSD